MKQVDKLLVKAVEAGIKAGLHWESKVWLRCTVEGCRYGVEGVDKESGDVCMYCGDRNMSKIFEGFPELKSIQDELKDK